MDDSGEPVDARGSGDGAVPHVGPVFDSVGEMRTLSGLSTESIAGILRVPHGTVCGWLAGTSAEATDLRRIDSVLVALRRVDRGSARENAALLLSPLVGSESGIDMLRGGRIPEFVRAAGEGCGRSEPLRVDRTRTPLRGNRPKGWLEAVVREGSADVDGAGSVVRGRETRRMPFPKGR